MYTLYPLLHRWNQRFENFITGLTLKRHVPFSTSKMHRKLYKTIRNLLTNRKNVLLLVLVVFLVYHLFPKSRGKRNIGWDEEEREKRVAVPDTLTIIVREYEDFDNRLYKTIRSAQGTGIPSLVIGDDIPYPPVKLPAGTNLLPLNTPPGQPAWRYQDYIHTTHVAIIPGKKL